MKVNVPGFDRPIFQPNAAANDGPSSRAARGFGALFGKIVAHELLKGVTDENSGLMGMGNGAGTEIYAGFLEDTLGKVLAGSPAMKPLVDQIRREMESRGGAASQTGLAIAQRRPLSVVADRPVASLNVSPALLNLPHDKHGPLLLPPPAGAYELLSPLPPPPQW
jgi:hypothetical protein